MAKPSRPTNNGNGVSAESVRTRVIWALLAGAVVIGILLAGAWLMFPLLIVILWIGVKELQNMLASKDHPVNVAFLMGGGVALFIVSLPWTRSLDPSLPWRDLVLWLTFGGILVYELFTTTNIPRIAFTILSFLYLPWALGYLLALRYIPDATLGLWTLLVPVVATVGTDVAAYFTGIYLGRHKLVPRLSPGKTVEGSLGGLAGSVVGLFILWGFAAWLNPEGMPFTAWELVLIGLFLSVVSQIGDLAESMLKRYYSIKDSGSFLPGHGGLLDRIDSLLFSIPTAYFLVRIFT